MFKCLEVIIFFPPEYNRSLVLLHHLPDYDYHGASDDDDDLDFDFDDDDDDDVLDFVNIWKCDYDCSLVLLHNLPNHDYDGACMMMILTTINYCWELELNLWGKLDSITITQTHHQRAELELASKLHCPYHDDVERDVGADNVDDDEKHLEAEAEREGEGDDDDDEGEAGEGPPEHHN